jgi:hypothetical protein
MSGVAVCGMLSPPGINYVIDWVICHIMLVDFGIDSPPPRGGLADAIRPRRRPFTPTPKSA